ncbi:MAG: thioredoxin domain-containing protein [Candidatus Acidiferrales bacterium]
MKLRTQFKLLRLVAATLLSLTCAISASLGGQSSDTANNGKQSKATASDWTQEDAARFRYTNRLIHAKSPYLLLHAHNPVDWYPWGTEAFEKARKENKPIFLSIGYFTCHWCHVMERESYSDPSVATILNQSFVSIKVDREERPDIDRLYIAYVEATTGSAGWPLNVLLTPDRKPFFGGTYFTPEQLKSLLRQVADAWSQQHDSIVQTAGHAAQQLVQIVSQQPSGTGELRAAILDQAYKRITSTYDAANGGFGGAPKFPRPVALCFLLRYYARTGQRESLDITLNTLRAMERGGIHDQLGGGFHRYSTGVNWLVPHFEKMLYDQAQLAITYTEAYQITHDRFYADTTRNILDFTLREMQQPRGGFASAEDADSRITSGKPETGEGVFYVWTANEIRSLMGNQDGERFGYAYGVESGGNIPARQDIRGELKGKNVLYEAHSTEETARKFGLTAEQTAEKLTAGRKALFEARSRRPQPPLDDKIVTAWNGMMISALARASQALDEPRYLERAQATAKFLEMHLYDPKTGKLWRSYRAGSPSVDGFLDDYTDLIAGLVDLYQAGFDVHWLTWAVSLQEKQDQLFGDPKEGGFFDVAASDPSLLSRTREAYDGAEPSPNSTAAMNLLRIAQFTDRAEWRERGEKTLSAFAGRLQSDPDAVPALASALDFRLAQTKQIVIAGSPGAPDTRALLRIVNDRFLPNKILLLADGGPGQEQLARWLPFVSGVKPKQGRATAYICENYVCQLPTSDPQVVTRLLDGKS